MEIQSAQFCETAKSIGNGATKLTTLGPDNRANFQHKHPPIAGVGSDTAAFGCTQRRIH